MTAFIYYAELHYNEWESAFHTERDAAKAIALELAGVTVIRLARRGIPDVPAVGCTHRQSCSR